MIFVIIPRHQIRIVSRQLQSSPFAWTRTSVLIGVAAPCKPWKSMGWEHPYPLLQHVYGRLWAAAWDTGVYWLWPAGWATLRGTVQPLTKRIVSAAVVSKRYPKEYFKPSHQTKAVSSLTYHPSRHEKLRCFSHTSIQHGSAGSMNKPTAFSVSLSQGANPSITLPMNRSSYLQMRWMPHCASGLGTAHQRSC